MRASVSCASSLLGRVRDHQKARSSCAPRISCSVRGIQISIHQYIAPSTVRAVSVHNAQGFFIVENARPGDQLACIGQSERSAKVTDLTLVLPAVAQRRIGRS